MSILDVLNGMQNGPHGESPSTPSGTGGMSKITMALLGLLAYKAYKGIGTQAPQTGQRNPVVDNNEPGGFAGVLRTIFGGGSVGSLLSNGVGNTVRDMEASGVGEIARSWVGRGQNQSITPQKLESALGADAVQDLMQKTGMTRDELLAALSQYLPRLVDHLTPQGRLPTEQEASRSAQ